MQRILTLLLPLALLLTGCAGILERSYSDVQPHAKQYWEDGTSSSAMRVSDYQSLVNGLLMLISNETDAALIRLYGYADRAAALSDMDSAAAEVSMEDPLGAYLLDYMTYECSDGVNCFEITVKLAYAKTPAQAREIVNATTAGALGELARGALIAERQNLAVRVGYMDRTAEEIEGDLTALMDEYGIERENWSVRYYPDAGETGDARIVEIQWQYPSDTQSAAE